MSVLRKRRYLSQCLRRMRRPELVEMATRIADAQSGDDWSPEQVLIAALRTGLFQLTLSKTKGHDMQTATQIDAQLERDARQAKAAGIPFNPKLPENFDDCDNRFRPASHQRWWNRPYIRTEVDEDPRWLAAWPSGIRYDVRCLDGGAWDRSTGWGMFGTIEEAIRCAIGRPAS